MIASRLLRARNQVVFTQIIAMLLCCPCVAQTVKAVHSFSSTGNSQYPNIVTPEQGKDGALYGTTTGLNFGFCTRI